MESIGTNIVEGLKNVLIDLFVPSTNKTEELSQIFNDKIPIWNQIQDIVASLTSDVVEKVPEFKVQINNYHSTNIEVNTIDLSWYEPFRNTVKNLLGAFLWLNTIVYLIRAVPKLLKGV